MTASEPTPSIMIAEDDRATRDAIRRALELEGYVATAVTNGQEALEAIEHASPSMIILDLMMPYVDGLSACRQLRSRGDRTSILLLTARSEVSDRVSGLDAGADDYLTKPFALQELLARVRALLRRSTYQKRGTLIVVGDLTIDEGARRAFRGQRELELTKTEFDLLQLLAFNAGSVLTHDLIYNRIWGYDFGGESKNLAVYIGYLRRKLEAEGESKLLRTVRGVGYSLVAP